MKRYEDTHAAIIGGTSGMGLATARLLQAHGATVLVTGRTDDKVQAARRALGDTAVALRSDAAELTDIDQLADHIKERFGGLNALFFCAGINRSTSIADTTEAIYDEVLATNTKAAYFTLKRLTPLMREGSGIVLATSVSDVKGLPNNSAYAASKAALRSMARTFARELLPQGVRVNAVSPGPIDTGILDRSMAPDAARALRAQLTANNPMGRFGSPEEIATAVMFLAYEATFTTGAELAVDGGVSQLV